MMENGAANGDNQQCPQCGARCSAEAQSCPTCGAQFVVVLDEVEAGEPLPFIEQSDEAKEAFDAELRKAPPPEIIPPTDSAPAMEKLPVIFAGPPNLKRIVPYEKEPDHNYLRGYSSGPGCGFYLLNHAFWPYAMFAIILRLLPDPPGGLAGVIYTLAFFIASIVFLIMLIRLGKTARIRRWEGLKWRSFSHFRSDENAWDYLGRIGWVLLALSIGLYIFSLAMVTLGGLIGSPILPPEEVLK